MGMCMWLVIIGLFSGIFGKKILEVWKCIDCLTNKNYGTVSEPSFYYCTTVFVSGGGSIQIISLQVDVLRSQKCVQQYLFIYQKLYDFNVWRILQQLWISCSQDNFKVTIVLGLNEDTLKQQLYFNQPGSLQNVYRIMEYYMKFRKNRLSQRNAFLMS